MIAGNKDEPNDVAIYWPRAMKRIERIRRTGRCPSASVPRRLLAGGTVALVDADGSVMLLFRMARIDEGLPVFAADGKKIKSGCVIVARKGTARSPGRRDPRVLSLNRHALGAFAYFDAETYRRVVYDPNSEVAGGGSGAAVRRQSRTKRDGRRRTPTTETKRTWPPSASPFLADNTSMSLDQPERRLVQAYATWVGDVRMFVHHPLKETGLVTDLFIPRRWTLVEAKANLRRGTMREAIGQLFDYQRHYDRSPSLAVLLPGRPPTDDDGALREEANRSHLADPQGAVS